MTKKKATEELLDQLHGLVTAELIDKIKSGEATAQDLGVAIRFLKDNSVKADPENNAGLKKLEEALVVHDVSTLPFAVGGQDE